MDLVARLAGEFALDPTHVRNALHLLDEQNTIPFVARYRKEQTGSMDEVQLRDLRDRATYLRELEERRATVLASIEEQGKLTDDLRARILAAETKQALEDLYLPYRPKRRTRATIAREKGLEPLADTLFAATPPADAEADAAVAAFVSGSEGEITPEEVWAGCRDILAERVAEDADTRAWVRDLTREHGRIAATATREHEQQKTRFSDYYDYEEPLRRIPPHRYLALRRGEAEKVLRVRVAAPEERIHDGLRTRHAPAAAGARLAEQWRLALEDAYQRLLAPAVEVELRVELKEAADEASISVFSENLRNLLLQPPGGPRVVMGLDPGFRTGSKWVVVDRTGRLLEHGTIYPLPPQNQADRAAQELRGACRRHGVEIVGVGNGTASRELLAFVRQTLRDADHPITPLLVNESGASVYSASDLAREEFPELDLTVRGAISIARRFQDPLAELVKIDPKSIGVGQYQHDVQQTRLRQSLDETVESCVNNVGVNLNTASWALLRYVSGLNAAQAKALVQFRDDHGPFANRRQLADVPRLGPKAFQQCAGFLRIHGATHPLDDSAVHPEHYPVVERMAADLGVALAELVANAALIDRIDPARYVEGEIGLPTLTDILAELRKPGRDPREPREIVQFSEAITEIGHLRSGMQLDGVVTNITHFGAFVDIGVHQDGLVHVSQLADRFVKDPAEVVKVGQPVRVTVMEVDTERKRIALSMKANPGEGRPRGDKPRAGKPHNERRADEAPRQRADRAGRRARGGNDAPREPTGETLPMDEALQRLNDRFRS